jgi:hypothetical protein
MAHLLIVPMPNPRKYWYGGKSFFHEDSKEVLYFDKQKMRRHYFINEAI